MLGMRLDWKGSSLMMIAGVWLTPGMNEIELEKSLLMAGCKAFHHQIDRGLLRVMQSNPDEKLQELLNGNSGKTSEASMLEMSAKEAIEIIKETYDITLLRKWNELESRKSVLSVIEKQIKSLIPVDKKDEE